MKCIAIIPARGGSKGIPRKNIRPLAGKPLIAWTIIAAQGVKSIDRIIVSTDDDEIALVAQSMNVRIIRRPLNLAQDDTPTLPVLQHVVATLAAEGYRPDAVMTLQPTSPLRTSEHIAEALAIFSADPCADSLVSVVAVPHIFHPKSVMLAGENGYLHPYLKEPSPTRRQDKEAVYARNGAAIYITRTDSLAKFIFGGRLLAYHMTPEDSIDIDSETDFINAEYSLLSMEKG